MNNLTEARELFENLLRADGKSLEALTPSVGIDAVLRFYEETRFAGCDFEHDGDMLLYQWGVYDWRMGDGEWFELDVTRSLSFPARYEEGDEDIAGCEQLCTMQLSLTFLYEPKDELRAIKKGDEFCHVPEDAVAFREFVANSEAFGLLANAIPNTIRFDFEEI